MGSYASLLVNEYEFFWMKSYVDPHLMTIFTEQDQVVEIEDEGTEDEYRHIYYKTTVYTAKKRLEIMGYNLAGLKHNFNQIIEDAIIEYDQDETDSIYTKEFLESFSFDIYLSTLKKIYDYKIDFFCNSSNYHGREKTENLKKKDLFLSFIIDEMEDQVEFCDFRYYLRGFLEKLNDQNVISIDVSELVHSGYYEDHCQIADESIGKEDKIIIFTEGKTDTYFIQKCMELLYPEFARYYSFLDIESSNLELNSSRLVSYIKSFISAGFMNKIIILFDNDAEGVFALSELSKLNKIPSNFAIKTYPDVPIAKKYPVICPTGIENLDINGSGAAIEIYFCEDLLLNEKNKLLPLQLKSYNEAIGRYQSAFSNKDKKRVQQEFAELLSQCYKDKSNIKKYNFESMKLLLEDLFTTFNHSAI